MVMAFLYPFKKTDPVFYYHSCWAVSKLKLKKPLVECMAVGLLTVLIDMPYDIIGIKYVHWIWHDTDPNICKNSFKTFFSSTQWTNSKYFSRLDDRHYWVPWNSYYFHLCFSTSFQFWFHNVRKWIEKRKDLKKWEAGSLYVNCFYRWI